jgi:hypothetical protein
MIISFSSGGAKMLTKIHSKVLHMIHTIDGSEEGRADLVDPSEFIQCSFLRMDEGKTFNAHKHLDKDVTFDTFIAQESWIVVRGSVKCFFYDLDDSLLETVTLEAGDASFALAGGHNYLIMEDDTLVYEYKTGPYLGHRSDKTFIGEVK